MKKIGIITHYNVHNHGAVLQLYALSKVLLSKGYEAKALRFNKNYDFMGGNDVIKKYNISLRSIPYYSKYLIKNGFLKTLFNIKKRKVLNKFLNDEKLVGEFYSNANDLYAVVIGSDEIFSIEAGPNPWYYGIGIPCKNQLSYAASFGPTTLDLIDKRNVSGLVEGGLKKIKYISVRDENSKRIVENLSDKIATIVCDPVLLYDGFNQQNGNEIEYFKKKIKHNYCIVYSYDDNMNDKETIYFIKKYAKENNLKIYSIGYYHKWCDKNIAVKPLDIFNWFSCADFVFTDTFHGSVISLVTNAQFLTKIRGNGNKLIFLLNQYGVENRITNNFDADNLTAIDYKIVNEKIVSIRKESLEFLSKIDEFSFENLNRGEENS